MQRSANAWQARLEPLQELHQLKPGNWSNVTSFKARYVYSASNEYRVDYLGSVPPPPSWYWYLVTWGATWLAA